jgi:predicted NodU family carbamoyl transferase
MNVLGISCFYHDAATCLVRDGHLIAAAEEERFSHRKHDPGFPHGAIRYCLAEGGVAPSDLDYEVFYKEPLVKFERILAGYVATFPRSRVAFTRAMETSPHLQSGKQLAGLLADDPTGAAAAPLRGWVPGGAPAPLVSPR